MNNRERSIYEEDSKEYSRLLAISEGRCIDESGEDYDHQDAFESMWADMMGFDNLEDCDPYDYIHSPGSFDIIAGVNTYDPGNPTDEEKSILDFLDEIMQETEDAEEDETLSDPPKCEDCKGSGVVVLFHSREQCETCGGSGY